ncbi:MAG: flagellar hook-associated protein 3 [Candidatus Dactylopiibacterium carminicum]|uniref:Flagellar hook-associated protein 3 n=1 Tax=Candidatus Dactylopiibacterium carminicum TaxID=857335 RepID=A0A272EV22_9RHOO|nr:flagellar hook-associated protein FlgL [Candidatus Dactylopiibacterium carminicum]KAF7599848.1 flagellar hook-associated protein 3 [Candidatus Dactylopiibacterium carminicum]PAS93959.1 MAG: flagellar hook-associated protein 3 [Candidatus Dactylopiibacterium carminicum]PAS99848.1 MAG: flagellar hook-associated protein 3 [Candidatus Dactylopiibacterium carminicum]
MRISTSMLYSTNVSSINRQQSSLLHKQQQLSTGRRVVSPSDDPVAAARALEVSQSIARVGLETKNQGTAMDSLRNLDSQLGAVSDVLNYVRERLVQAGNGSLSDEDRKTMATDIRSQFESLMGVANTRDSDGEYLFSGYQGEVQPFTGSIAGVSYQGDQGTRTLQVSSTRHIPTSISGNELFMNISSVNGVFSTSGTSMTAAISDGKVSGPVAYDGGQYGIRFTSATTFEVFDTVADPTMSGTPLLTGTYTDGEAINLPDPGNAATAQIQISISGSPAVGDTFNVTPGSSTDMFGILQNIVVGLESVTDPEGYKQMVADSLGQLDNALENVLRLRSQVGSRQVEVEALQNIGADLKIQYADRLERLVGLDYVEAISDFQQQSTYLEAARNTFSKISGLSLFNFIS